MSSPVARSTRKTLPDTVNTAVVQPWSVSYEVMPSADSRRRSRTARSASERSDLALSSLGSTMSRSRPVFESHAQRQVTGSLPLFDRAKNTVEWSGLIRRSRGSPREKRRVRAYWRGKESVVTAQRFPQRSLLRRHPRRHLRQPW